jgi:hypothetical protein
MIKKIFAKSTMICLITLISTGMMTACSSDDNNEPGQDPGSDVFHPINASTRTLRDIYEKSEYTPTEFGDAMGSWPMLSFGGDALARLLKTAIKTVALTRVPQMDALFKERVGTAADGSRQWKLKRRVFTYKSISSVTGNDTTLVGSVIFPTNTIGQPHQVDVLTLYHHQGYLDESWLPSHSVTMMAMHALHNSAVIEPDGQGSTFTLDKMDEADGATQGDLVALQMADCVLAALEVMRQENVTLEADGYTNNWGTSLGAYGATGFAQYMENDATPDLQALFKLSATFIGEGPVMPNHNRGYEDAVDTEVQKYYDGWNPRLPFYISCTPDDEMISYDGLKKYYTQLRTMPDGSVNDNVHWYDFYMPGVVKRILNKDNIREKFAGMPIHILSSILTLYDASIVKDPADMEKVLVDDSMLPQE